MNGLKLKRLALCASMGLVMAQMMACSSTGSPSVGASSAADQYDAPHRNRRQIYAGAGLGLSRLEPDTSGRPLTDVSDSSSVGGQLTLGMDLSRQFTAELHAASLGSAAISGRGGEGDIDYSIAGVSGLFYAGKNRHNYKRRGLTGYGRLGVGMLQNAASGDLEYEKINAAHLLLGIGAEYNTRSGLGIRGELVSYEGDANVLQLALIYRFNRKQREYVEPLAEATLEPATLVAPVAAVAVVLDGDRDGVSDQYDRCLETAFGVSVNEEGCALFSGVIEGVNFHSNSADLTTNAKSILDDVAVTLGKYPAANVQVKAHTDSQGDDAYNLSLSQKRARSVSQYLAQRGVSLDRLAASAYGETQPIADNGTREGRQKNRRVELFATQ